MDDEDENGMFVAQDGGERRPPPPGYNPIYLPDVDPRAFLEFHKWLLKDDLKVDDAGLLVKTYLLAHHFRAEGFRNKLLDDVREFFANNRNTRVNLDSMLELANGLDPERARHRGQNRLLEFLVWQLTFEIVMRGYEHYENNAAFHQLLRTSGKVMKWHLKALWELNPSQAALVAKKKRQKRERARDDEVGHGGGRGIKRDADTSDDEDEKPPLPGKKKRTLVPYIAPAKPSENIGCVFHEHVDSRECSGQVGKEGKRRRMVIIDP